VTNAEAHPRKPRNEPTRDCIWQWIKGLIALVVLDEPPLGYRAFSGWKFSGAANDLCTWIGLIAKSVIRITLAIAPFGQ
jgi:hypothetical protein